MFSLSKENAASMKLASKKLLRIDNENLLEYNIERLKSIYENLISKIPNSDIRRIAPTTIPFKENFASEGMKRYFFLTNILDFVRYINLDEEIVYGVQYFSDAKSDVKLNGILRGAYPVTGVKDVTLKRKELN